MNTKSIWANVIETAAFPLIQYDIMVDVAIVGGGITSITAAYLLAKAGKRAAVLDA